MPLADGLSGWRPRADERLEAYLRAPQVEQVGRVASVGDGIAFVSGLPEARTDELLSIGADMPALVMQLEEERIGCLLLGAETAVVAGDLVRGSGEILRVPVGDDLLGRVIDPLSRPLDEGPPVTGKDRRPVERPAPPIIERDFVSEPLQTGVLVIDAMFPIGRGQRELIIGDRSTGKTSLALDAIIDQQRSDVVSVYVAIGQKSSSTRQVVEAVRAHGALDRCLFVVAAADSPPGLQWLAPFAAFTMAEHFRDGGRHALVVIDDLTKHAAAHRQIALLLRQPPGREAYPGDIFYLHARLLERAAKLASDKGGGSLTALPIAETQAENLSAYIPTNLISITDGQIYLSARLFGEGQKPAVDVGRSVSRVGGKAQAPALRHLAERLRLDYTQFLELEVFTRFGAITDERTRTAIERGRRIRALLTQERHAVLPLGTEIALLLALGSGLLDALDPEAVGPFKERLGARVEPLVARIEERGELDEATRAALLDAARGLVRELSGGSAPAGAS